MIVAVISTKMPILEGHDVGPFHLAADIKRLGFWSAQHEARADLTMFLGLLFLLIVGAGQWSFDALPDASSLEYRRGRGERIARPTTDYLGIARPTCKNRYYAPWGVLTTQRRL
jgi:hypothetical protein